jgi:ArsR family transcriptional regulator, arsenate/arsenite/antimonite-responsive transcriptional repressor
MSRARKSDQTARAGTLKPLVQVAKAIGHPARLRILAMLSGRTLCVCQMTSVLELASSTVSGHLNELRRSGLVIEDKHGKLVFYRLDERSPFADLVTDTLALAETDETIGHDRALIDRVRAVPIEVLTRAGLRLDRVGIKRPTLRGAPAHG